MNRRSFLRIAGGGVVLAAGAGALFAATRTPTAAMAPWGAAGSYADPRLNALSWAILSPNPHNRQPWIVELRGEDTAILRFDTDRQLPETDPFDRQLTIGLGCFLELAEMAANASGHRMHRTLFPEGESADGLDTRPVAILRFIPDASVAADPLWTYVPDRRSNKEPYDIARAVPQSALEPLLASARHGGMIGGTVDAEEVPYWRALTEEALRIEIETPRTFQESVDLFRIGKREVLANPDGIDFTGPLFEGLALAGLFTRESAGDTSSVAYRQGLDAVNANARSAMGLVWLITDGNSRVNQIGAGGDWLRINLAATAGGLGIQPMSQALQEYPEMHALYAEVHDRLAPDGGTVQMLARIGYGQTVPASPRWPLEAKLVTA
ncbi:twin-arginine translocation pathway signal protein [Rhodobacterales bacterium HKCCE3408]|nr:twin-arginine translocation pathway signal protein [Rhodobacterales bacterium HKCCE3408]